MVDEDADWPAEWKEDADLKLAIDEGDYEKASKLMEETRQRIERLKAFKDWLDSHGLRRTYRTQKELNLEVERALNAWRPHTASPKSTKPASPRPLEIPAGYREWLERECADIIFSSSLKIQQGQALRLTHLYVPAIVSGQDREAGRPGDPERLQEASFRSGKGEELPPLLLERLGRYSLYVSGDPGSGKSVFCRWAALATVLGKVPDLPVAAPEGYSETLPEALQGRLPLLLRLRVLWEKLPSHRYPGGAGQPGLDAGRLPGHSPGQELRPARGQAGALPPALSGRHRAGNPPAATAGPGAEPRPNRRSAHPRPAGPGGLCAHPARALPLPGRLDRDRGCLLALPLSGDQQPVREVHRGRRLPE